FASELFFGHTPPKRMRLVVGLQRLRESCSQAFPCLRGQPPRSETIEATIVDLPGQHRRECSRLKADSPGEPLNVETQGMLGELQYRERRGIGLGSRRERFHHRSVATPVAARGHIDDLAAGQ